MAAIYRGKEAMPEKIPAFEWQTILADTGASPEEIADVQAVDGAPVPVIPAPTGD
jgi:hypothetical protein